MKEVFKSKGAYLGVLLFGIVPLIDFFLILFSNNYFDLLLAPIVINPFLWGFFLFDSFVRPLNSGWMGWLMFILIFGSNFIIGLILGWIAETIIKRKEVAE